jgi:septum formation protein
VPARPALILASGSPRRRFLLSQAGLTFEVRPADVDESALPGEEPRAQALRLARLKARAVAEGCGPDAVVLGADTIVVLDGRVYDKPRDAEEAVSHLTALSGRRHRVITAVALVATSADPAKAVARELAVESEVHLRAARAEEIRAYVATGEPLDKAGAYALQGEGGSFVEKVEGSETNVIGLPMHETLALLAELGVAQESVR